jgi:hypothetical protein
MSWGFAVVVLTTLSFVAFSSAACAGDLKEITAKQKIAIQKLKEEVSQAISDSRNLERKDPARALKILEACQSKLQDDVLLSDTQRQSLLNQVNTRIAAVRIASRASAPVGTPGVKFGSGKPAGEDRNKKLVDETKGRLDGIKGGIALDKKLLQAREQGLTEYFRDTQASLVLPKGDYEVNAKRLAAILARGRDKPKMTKKEQEIMRILNSVLTVDWDDAKLREVLDHLEKKTGQKLPIDKKTMEELDISYDTPVSFKASKASVRTILRKVLGDLGLTYIVKDEIIQIVTPQKARETMTTRSYPILDLMTNNLMAPIGTPLGQFQMQQNAQMLIDMITSTIEPQSWKANGGEATITFDPLTNRLIVRQTAEFHLVFGNGLGR